MNAEDLITSAIKPFVPLHALRCPSTFSVFLSPGLLLLSSFPMSPRKLPPQVARELMRHVQVKRKPPTTTTTSTGAAAASASTTSSTPAAASMEKLRQRRNVLIGCLAFTGFAASIPFLAMKWIGPLNSKDDALTPAQVRRGPFLNSGSRDVGKDPKWNFETGTYQHDPDLFKHDNPGEIELGEEYAARAKRRR